MKRKFWNWIKNETEGTRTLFLTGEISDETWWGDEVTPKIFKDELMSGEGDIILWINSPGGDVFAASQIYNMLMEYSGNVTVKIDSLAASAASVIAMAGTEVLMSPTSLMMIHNPLTVAIGDTEEMQKAISMLEEVKESIINAYELKTGLSRSKISQLMDAETWLNAKKAVELGFADGILYDRKPEDIEPEAMMFSSMGRFCDLLRINISKNAPFIDSVKNHRFLTSRAVTNSLLNKLKEPPKGTPYSELEKRLNLLK